MKNETVVQSRTDRRLRSLCNAPALMVLLVLIVPSNIVGLASALGYATFAGKDSSRLLPLLVATALFLASFNSTKIPVSDLYSYQLASEFLVNTNFNQLLLRHGHEPGYYFLNWLHVHQFGFSWTSWVFFFSFLFYFLWLNALRMLVGFLNLNRFVQLSILIVAAFFPLVFIQSSHLVRQYIASSIALVGLVRFLIDGRGWVFFFLAPLFHVFAAIFLVVPVSAWLGQKSRRKAAIFSLVSPLLLVLGARFIGQFLVSLEALGVPRVLTYGISRMSQEQFYDLDEIGATALVFSLICLIVSQYTLAFGISRISYDYKQIRSRLAAFITFNAVLSGSIVLLSIFGLTEPATRLFQIVLLQFPFLIAILTSSSQATRLLAIGVGSVMPFAFLVFPTAWEYGDTAEILLLPYYVFLLQT